MRIIMMICIFLFSNTLLGQVENEERIYWHKDRSLKWDDFQGEVDSIRLKIGSRIGASLYLNFEVIPIILNGKVTQLRVYAYFIKTKSWKTEEIWNSVWFYTDGHFNYADYALKHEQTHFDIGEIYARKMRRMVRELLKKGVSDINIFYNEISRYHTECEIFQEKYDNETFHGMVNILQDEWNNFIAKELELLKEFDASGDFELEED